MGGCFIARSRKLNLLDTYMDNDLNFSRAYDGFPFPLLPSSSPSFFFSGSLSFSLRRKVRAPLFNLDQALRNAP